MTTRSIAELRMARTKLHDQACSCVQCEACDGQKFVWDSDTCDYPPCAGCAGAGVTAQCERCRAILEVERELVIAEVEHKEREDERTGRDRCIFEQWLPTITGDNMGRGADVSRWEDDGHCPWPHLLLEYRDHDVRVMWAAWRAGQFSPHRAPAWDLHKIHAAVIDRHQFKLRGPFLHGDIDADGCLICSRCCEPLAKDFLDEIASDALQLRAQWTQLMSMLSKDVIDAIERAAAELDGRGLRPQGDLFAELFGGGTRDDRP